MVFVKVNTQQREKTGLAYNCLAKNLRLLTGRAIIEQLGYLKHKITALTAMMLYLISWWTNKVHLITVL
jgi:hypothetical protein